MLSAVVARLANPEIHLAAYGGVVFPIALIIESPIIMLLAASTALTRDAASYGRLRRFMMASGFLLTVLHLLVAVTPLYGVIAGGWIGAPLPVLEPARIGLLCMLPWTWAIAHRRFNQGILIRFGHSGSVGVGTAIRLAANAVVLALGWLHGGVAGIVVATCAVSTGVLAEAAYAAYRVRPCLVRLRSGGGGQILRWREFAVFYLPLALTSLFTLLVQPMLTGAISRLPMALTSLAAWPALNGLVFMLKSLGLAYNEVVVALMDRPNGPAALRRFTRELCILVSGTIVLVAGTPLADYWFRGIAGLDPDLVAPVRRALWTAALLPALGVLASWFQGVLVHERNTRPITESVLIFMVVSGCLLVVFVSQQRLDGLQAAFLAMTAGALGQTGWLCLRKYLSARMRGGED